MEILLPDGECRRLRTVRAYPTKASATMEMMLMAYQEGVVKAIMSSRGHWRPAPGRREPWHQRRLDENSFPQENSPAEDVDMVISDDDENDPWRQPTTPRANIKSINPNDQDTMDVDQSNAEPIHDQNKTPKAANVQLSSSGHTSPSNRRPSPATVTRPTVTFASPAPFVRPTRAITYARYAKYHVDRPQTLPDNDNTHPPSVEVQRILGNAIKRGATIALDYLTVQTGAAADNKGE